MLLEMLHPLDRLIEAVNDTLMFAVPGMQFCIVFRLRGKSHDAVVHRRRNHVLSFDSQNSGIAPAAVGASSGCALGAAEGALVVPAVEEATATEGSD